MNEHELDNLMRGIARDAALDEATANEIADSPTLWWNVQREIRNAEPVKAPWPPKFLRRWLTIGLPVAAAIVIAAVFFIGGSKDSKEVAETPAVGPTTSLPDTSTSPSTARSIITEPSTTAIKLTDPGVGPRRAAAPAKNDLRTKSVPQSRTLTARRQPKTSTEIRSEFIALAYAREPESGQLLRVKVPSSMMVTLGVVPTVEKPSELVDAEVLVGDDGLTHAIRFVRQ